MDLPAGRGLAISDAQLSAILMADTVLLVLSTFPDLATARQIARKLVEEKCAACANILPVGESIYRWQEKVDNGAEILVFFKTSERSYGRFEAVLRELHSYE